MGMFREALEKNDLYDIGYVGDCFTWSNGHNDHTFTKERLDKFVANKEWRERFQLVKVEGLVARSSDHKPLLMTAGIEKYGKRRRKFWFKFEASWLKEEDCEMMVKKVWERKQMNYEPIKQVLNLLQRCSGELTRGFSKRDREREGKIELLTKQIKNLQETEGPEVVDELKKLKREVVLRSGEDEIAEAFKRHFSEVYKSESPSREVIEECIRPINTKVTSCMNEVLEKRFCREEVEIALRDMGPHKSSGPDGYSACFYQNLWRTVGGELSNPVKVGDFRPISLCNVLYKLIAKTLANRLKKVLDGVVSQNQSAFIPGRLITDNIVTAYEALHSIKTRLKGKMGAMALKLDISKAYDRVEWRYLETIMVKMGFGKRWISLIMGCITTVSYAMLLNRQPGEVIIPTRSLRQGCPLSPYLFLLCAEGLSGLLNEAERAGRIRGVAVARGGVKLTHLLFADDCIIFGRACWEEWVRIRGILQLYERASGQCLNKQKTTIMFSSNGRKGDWERITTDLGARVQHSFEKYLGLPAMVGKSKYDTFKGIKDRVWQRIHNWKNQFLSPAGKEVLLKAVIQSIPTYCMSVFALPKKLCKEIAAEMEKFWWSFKRNDKKIRGLGFRELESFNKALLAKQCWRVLTNPESITTKVLHDKYFKSSGVLDAKLGRNPSLIWRSLWGALDLLKEGLVWRVGNGKSINIWGDRWIPQPSSYKIQSPVKCLTEVDKVAKLIDESKGEWKKEIVKEVFNEGEAEIICRLPISKTGRSDKQIWALSKNGIFNVKSAYHFEMQRRRRLVGESSKVSFEKKGWSDIWRLKIPGVTKLFIWKALNNCLPTRRNLYRRKVIENPNCPICNRYEETICHALWSCDAAVDVWAKGSSPVQKWSSEVADFGMVWKKVIQSLSMEDLELVAIVLRNIWLRRNKFVFESLFNSPANIFKQAEITWADFKEANCIESQKGNPAIREVEKWRKPREGMIKVNLDAAFMNDSKRMRVGIVCRDQEGDILFSACMPQSNAMTASQVEVVALWKTMKLCEDLQVGEAELEGDASCIVKAVNSKDESWEWGGQIIEDIRGLLNNRSYWSVCHTRREGNKARIT
ncbi:uncharacterized protein LOC121267211 [Juglans microcarpa x Juglans regia]|uniref:uncharacterized protein LOC121267211 n=1 Tax=Juglans microcarpa x Juglans regia TaxID=2249226 RepID=UPI001B7E6E68|nr:uncharacterized protein LOC121267211 [Juglans microcarpa x Juglans regia]